MEQGAYTRGTPPARLSTGGLDSEPMTAPLWTPSPEQIARANMTAFLEAVRAGHGADAGIENYHDLWAWSVAHPDQFWPAVWSFCGVISAELPGGRCWDAVVTGLDRMAPPDPELGPRWFLGARLNFAENLLCHRDDRDALVFWNELGRRRALTFGELAAEVAAFAAALTAAAPARRAPPSARAAAAGAQK